MVVVVALPLLSVTLFQSAWLIYMISKAGPGVIGRGVGELGAYAMFIAPFAYASGQAFVLFYGAPLYALLSQRGFANWLTAALVGVLPGVVVLLIAASAVRPLRTTGLGLLFLVYGLFVALTTHATMVRVARTASANASAEVRSASSAMYRQWSRALVLTAVLGGALTFWDVIHAGPGSFAGIGFVYGAVELSAPFVLAALACLLRAYFLAAKPRPVGPLVEAAGVLVAGAMLSVPGLQVFLTAIPRASQW